MVVSLVVALQASACQEAPSDEHVVDDPVTLVEVDGTDLAHVVLTAQAAERLGITTAPVEQAEDGIVVPTAAVIVDPDGGLWVYTNSEPLSFVRQQIELDHEDGDLAYLADGPSTGTQVVTLGAAELYGAEKGIGH